MINLRATDSQARREARSEFTRPVVLEAGAGTGKTAVLVARVVCWCMGPGWERWADTQVAAEDTAVRVLEGVVALTFTDRAAAEMEQRTALALSQIHEGRPVVGLELSELGLSDEQRGCRAGALLAGIDRFGVSTIHGFCRRLLGAYPLEAGLHPAFDVDADGVRTTSVVDDLLAERLQDRYGDPGDPPFEALASLGVGPGRLADALLQCLAIGLPQSALDVDIYGPARLSAAVGRLRRLLEQLIASLGDALHGKRARKLAVAFQVQAVVQALSQLTAHVDRIEQLQEILDQHLTQSVVDRVRRWGQSDFSQSEGQCFGARCTEVAVAARALHEMLTNLSKVCAKTLPLAMAALGALLGEARQRLGSRGVVSFAELLQQTRQLLTTYPDVRRRIRQGIDQLLVDEFQDTDPVQCDIVEYLALDGEPAERPGLFIVGDPKQSIYGWRSADLRSYESFIQRAVSAGGEIQRLSVNFRSTGAIVDEVERVVEPIMRYEPGLQPPFEPLVAVEQGAVSPTAAEDLPPVEYWVSWAAEASSHGGRHGPETTAEEARQREAVALADDLSRLDRNGGFRWGHAAVLMRATTHQDTYLRALRQAGIPYVVERDRSYFRRREVIDAAAALRAVLDPHDHLALLTLLRSPYIGLPDAALLPLWRGGFPELVGQLLWPDHALLSRIDALIDEAEQHLPPDVPGLDSVRGWPHVLRATTRYIGELRRAFEQAPVDHFLALFRRLLPVEATEAARFLGEHRLANVQRLLRQIGQALADQGRDAHSVLRQLRLAVGESRDEQEASLGDQGLDAVRVMTIHKAKGLTFEYVYLVGLHSRTSPAEQRGIVDAERCGDCWEVRLFGVPSLGFDEVLRHRRRVQAAEDVRTLYVALTRPRRRLVLAGRWPRRAVTDFGDGLRATRGRCSSSHMDLLQGRRGGTPDLQSAQRALADGVPESAERFVGSHGEHWWLLSRLDLARESGSKQRAQQRDGIVSALLTAEQETERVVAARMQARRLAELPLVSSISEIGQGLDAAAHAHQADEDRGLGDQALVAQLAGTAVHRVLERLDLGPAIDHDLERRQRDLRRYMPACAATVVQMAERRAAELLERLRQSETLERLRRLESMVVGRELPLLLDLDAADDSPLNRGAAIGTVDLLYHDEDNGQLVVVDYKTDRLVNPQQLQQRSALHARQAALYGRAVERAFPHQGVPRCELWFLWADRIVVVGDGDSRPCMRDRPSGGIAPPR